jgi:hypothetical protein
VVRLEILDDRATRLTAGGEMLACVEVVLDDELPRGMTVARGAP